MIQTKPAVGCLLGLLVLGTSCAFAQGDNSARLIEQALAPSPIETNLQRLTDEVGGRVPGTPAMQRAIAWGEAAFKAAGADSVHREEFMMPHSWAEGATEVTVSAGGEHKVDFRLRAVSIALAPPILAKGVPIVDVGFGTEADFKKAGNVEGKLLLVHSDVLKVWADLFNEYESAPPIIDRAVRAKAKAIAFTATREHDVLYRHTNALHGEIDKLPMILVAREDAERVGRLLGKGLELNADLSVPNVVGGPVGTANVVAELKGREHPDEFVVIGAHLDSWELGTGALDNGCNAALVIDALRAIKAAGLQPRRSIRFVLFSGEEQGMIGSREYVVRHRDELEKNAGMTVIDSGIGRVTGFSVGGRKDVVAAVEPLVASLASLGASQLTTNDVEWGTDNFDFMLEGVPTFVANQEEGNYLVNYHATSDTFDKVDIAQLKKHVAEMTVLTFGLADAPQRIGPRLSHSEIEKILVDTHADEQLKPLGIWDEWQNGKRGRAK
jgi:Zn-dependent M28 family amino/carboxypeptidase